MDRLFSFLVCGYMLALLAGQFDVLGYFISAMISYSIAWLLAGPKKFS